MELNTFANLNTYLQKKNNLNKFEGCSLLRFFLLMTASTFYLRNQPSKKEIHM